VGAAGGVGKAGVIVITYTPAAGGGIELFRRRLAYY